MDSAQLAALPEWLTAEDVAQRLGVSARSVRRMAMQEDWLTQQQPSYGRYGFRLLYHRSCLLPRPRAGAQEAGLLRLSQAPDWSQARAEARRDLIVMIEERLAKGQKSKQRRRLISRFCAGEFATKLADSLGKVSYRTYMRWLAAYRAEGVAALLPAHKGRSAEIPPDVLAELKDLALKKPRAAAVIHDMLNEKYSGRVPSYGAVLRLTKAIRKEYAEEYLYMHKGPTAHRHATLTALGRSDAKALHPNHMWEIDTTPADVVDSEGKRRKIIGIVDVYSRRYHFRAHESSSGYCVAQTIRSAILAWGLPAIIIMDNGKDYQSKRVQTMCEELGIHIITNPPFCPEKKPHVERSFRTLSRRVFRELTGSTGHDLTARPEVIVPRYTMSQIQEIMDSWVENYWHEQPLSVPGKGKKRPRELAGDRAPKMISNERVLDILLGDVGKRKIRQGYIHYRNRKYFHEMLLTLDAFGEVELREDAADVGRIYVFRDRRYLCTAIDMEHLGLKPEEFSELQRRKLSLAKARVNQLKASFGGGDPDADFAEYLDRLKKKKPASLPGPQKVVEFPNLDKAAAASPAPAPEEPSPDAGERPLYWDDPATRYEWCLKNAKELLPEDADFMGAYEKTREYRDTREGWDFLRAQLKLDAVEGGA